MATRLPLPTLLSRVLVALTHCDDSPNKHATMHDEAFFEIPDVPVAPSHS